MSQDIKTLKLRRSVLKRHITASFKRVADSPLAPIVSSVTGYLLDVRVIDDHINTLMFGDYDSEESYFEAADDELKSQSEYSLSIKIRLAELENKMENKSDVKPPIANHQITVSEAKLPEIKCSTFSGENSSQLEYHSFISLYESIIGNRKDLSNVSKLIYLKSYLSGYAAKVINHLTNSAENYQVALTLLNGEFLDEKSVINALITKFFELKPKYDPTYLETKIFLNETRCIINDLQIYGMNLESEIGGNAIVTHVIFNKLSIQFQQELLRKLNGEFPKLCDLYANYIDVIRTLTISKKTDNYNSVKTFSKPIQTKQVVRAAVSNNTFQPSYCKFCCCSGHSMVSCDVYATHSARKNRCLEMKLCHFCSSAKHNSNDCKKSLNFQCKYCSSSAHISALCTKFKTSITSSFCFNSCDSGANYILPSVTVTLSLGNVQTNVRCLIDTGSQRSYISSKAFKRLNCDDSKLTKLHINTFIDSAFIDFNISPLSIDFHDGRKPFRLPFLINDKFDLNYRVDGLKTVCTNLSQSYKLADNFNSDEICLEGLLGVDAIQLFNKFEFVTCSGGKAISLANGIVPIGNVDSFLTRPQLKLKYATSHSETKDIPNSSLVNFILNPIKTDFDPIGSIAKDSMLDSQLDKMFSIESLGIKEESCSHDEFYIEKFKESIELINGQYQVDIPWTDKVSQVKSNYQVSCKVLDRVYNKLINDNLYDEYNAVFEQQLEDGIIEDVTLNQTSINQNIFIPHRPVIKRNLNTTTKVRVVVVNFLINSFLFTDSQ